MRARHALVPTSGANSAELGWAPAVPRVPCGAHERECGGAGTPPRRGWRATASACATDRPRSRRPKTSRRSRRRNAAHAGRMILPYGVTSSRCGRVSWKDKRALVYFARYSYPSSRRGDIRIHTTNWSRAPSDTRTPPTNAKQPPPLQGRCQSLARDAKSGGAGRRRYRREGRLWPRSQLVELASLSQVSSPRPGGSRGRAEDGRGRRRPPPPRHPGRRVVLPRSDSDPPRLLFTTRFFLPAKIRSVSSSSPSHRSSSTIHGASPRNCAQGSGGLHWLAK